MPFGLERSAQTASLRRFRRSVSARSRDGSRRGSDTMGDKSPKHDTAKKPSVKSIKEKRLEKKARADTTSQMENLTHGKKH
jgi:hypothetical protein